MVRAVLMGPPGAGKSSVARALSKVLQCDLVDTDGEIEATTGRKIADIFTQDGEANFREIESVVVKKALETATGVIALGGGSILDTEVAAILQLKKFPVVFLEVSIAQAAPRVGFNKERPLLALNPRQQWLALMQLRRPIYESLATITVQTDNKKPLEVANEIARQLVVQK